jgi:hypothetical protein
VLSFTRFLVNAVLDGGQLDSRISLAELHIQGQVRQMRNIPQMLRTCILQNVNS